MNSKSGEKQSWNNGGVPMLDGPDTDKLAGGGGTKQCIAPRDIIEVVRDVYSAYIRADFHLIDRLMLAPTVRSEHYSDFGWTTTGKIFARYHFSPAFALRGTLSTGYHAPGVGQLAYQSSGYAGT